MNKNDPDLLTGVLISGYQEIKLFFIPIPGSFAVYIIKEYWISMLVFKSKLLRLSEISQYLIRFWRNKRWCRWRMTHQMESWHRLTPTTIQLPMNMCADRQSPILRCEHEPIQHHRSRIALSDTGSSCLQTQPESRRRIYRRDCLVHTSPLLRLFVLARAAYKL